jgi:hypothetical protein
MKKSPALIFCAVALAACSGNVEAPEANPTPHDSPSGPGLISGKSGNILDAFGSGGGLFGGISAEDIASAKLGVNSYLWRATLETINFLPLKSADSTGGVIITDWRTRPDDSNERVKATAYIFGTKLTPQAVQVKLFKQRKREGVWTDVPASAETARQLEDAILTRARKLRVQARATEE